MNGRSIIYLLLASLSTIANAEPAMGKIGDNLYASIGENAILLLLATQLGQVVWHMGKWIVDKYFREQKDKDAEVKRLKVDFDEFRGEITGALTEIKTELKHMAKAPSEEAIVHRLSDKMKVMVLEAMRDNGSKSRRSQ